MNENRDSWKPEPYSKKPEEPSVGETTELDALTLDELRRQSIPKEKEARNT